jgi:NitT/TauT family transport system substrate-binding protein
MKRIATIVVVVLVAVLAVGAAHAQIKNPLTLRLADGVGSELVYGPVWIALHKGYFAEEGITIVRKTYANGPAMLLGYNKGETDAVMAGLAPFLQAAAQGSDYVMIMSITKDNAPIVARAEIKTPKDLNGKAVGSPGLGTIQDLMLTVYEQKHGISVKHVHAKITDLVAMLEKGEIAAFTGWETVAATAVMRVKGAHYLAPRPAMPGAESLEIIVNRQLAQSNPEAVVGFTRAVLKGMRYYQKYEDEGLRFIAKVINTPEAFEVARVAKGQIVITEPYLHEPTAELIYKAGVNSRKILPERLPSFADFMKRYVDYSYLKKAEDFLRGWEPTK